MSVVDSYRRKKLKKLAGKIKDRKGYIKKAGAEILAKDYKAPKYKPVNTAGANPRTGRNEFYKPDMNTPDVTDQVKMVGGTYAFKGLTHMEAEKKKLKKKLKK